MFKNFKSLSKVYIIAEIGVNHNGSLSLAKKLINKAKKIGADCVKFQLFKAENLVQSNTPLARYQKKNLKKNITQKQMLKSLEFDLKQIKLLLNYSKKQRIDFLCTPYNLEDLLIVKRLKIKAVKLSSMHATENYFIEEALKLNKPVLLPTGMCDLKDLYNIKKIIKKSKNKNVCIMQCTTNYPTELSEANINVLKSYKKIFKNLVLGFSDHTKDNLSSCAATSIGVKVIEKHFTLSNSMKGPDHIASLNPKNFRKFIKDIRNTELALGSEVKKITNSEKKNKKTVKRSIVYKQFLNKGTVLKKKHITFKRPLNGIPAGDLDLFLNKKLKKNVNKDKLLKKENF